MVPVIKKKLIIDTDGVADDVQAISLALQHPECEVIAFTTVHGCTSANQAAANVARTLRANGITKKIPIFEGCATPLVEAGYAYLNIESIFGSDGIGGDPKAFPEVIDSDFVPEPEPAAVALIRLTKENPDATLLCLGPLTNLALALKLDPRFCEQPKNLVIMGGNYYGIGNAGPAEFNFFGDPEAAALVIKNMKSDMILIPWEASFLEGPKILGPFELVVQSHIDEFQHQRVVDFHAHKHGQTPLSRFLTTVTSRISDHMAAKNKQFPFCDEVAAAVAISPNEIIVKKKRLWADIELHGALTRGQVVIDWRNSVWDETEEDYVPNESGKGRVLTFVASYNVQKVAEWMMNAVNNA